MNPTGVTREWLNTAGRVFMKENHRRLDASAARLRKADPKHGPETPEEKAADMMRDMVNEVGIAGALDALIAETKRREEAADRSGRFGHKVGLRTLIEKMEAVRRTL